MAELIKGQRVSAVVYGEKKTGVVDSFGPHGKIVWVKMDGGRGLRWLHPESLKVEA